MLTSYPACFLKEENGYSVIFPDLDGLSTCGETLDAAMTAGVDCLAGYLYWLQQEHQEAPAPSAPDALDSARIAADLDVSAAGAFVSLVTVDVAEYARTHFEKAVKKTLTIPAWLNTAALERGINFSKVLQDALKAQLQLG